MSVYVGNLSYDATDEDIKEVFAEYGQVKRVQVPSDRETGRPRGFAFVEMETEEEETAADIEPNDNTDNKEEHSVSETSERNEDEECYLSDEETKQIQEEFESNNTNNIEENKENIENSE